MKTNHIVYITTLTPLRGIAALLVVIFHSNLMLQTFMPPGITGLVGLGWLWVDFFFILSGFIMTYVYGQTFRKSVNKTDFLKYVGTRFARVYPLNLFTMLIALCLAIYIRMIAEGIDPFINVILNPWAAPASALFLQGMHLFETAPLNTPSWSLSTEWWMYMIFPFLVPIFIKLKNGGKVFVLLFIITIYLVLIYLIGPISGPFKGNYSLDIVADFGFLRCAVGFILGMWIHEIYRDNIGQSLFEKDITFIISFISILIAMHFELHNLAIIVLFCFTILSATYNHGYIKKLLDTRPLQLLGNWSFSIYMVHLLIIYLFWINDIKANPKFFSNFLALISRKPDYTKGVIRLLILLTSTLILSAMTYRYIEIPSRNYVRKKINSI